MNQNEPKYNRVVAYIRKSSEDNERGEANKQVNSLQYQGEFVDEAIQRYDLELLRKPFSDDKTGYEAFVRDSFNEMLKYLEENKGKVDGIVCTEISRLARNFADGGMILWYLQSGVIKRIYTPSKVFTDSSSDQLMVAIEFAMSKKSSDDTGERTKFGMVSKVKNMRHPARPAVLGYKTVGKPGAKKWIIDKKAGPLVVKVFEKFAGGTMKLRELSEYAYSIGLTSSSSKSKTGKISFNTWRNRLRDEHYIGIFYQDEDRIIGAYKPLIEDSVFFEVQKRLEDKAHPKSTHLTYAYTGMFACPDCGKMLSGTHKKSHTYYRCDKRTEPCKSKKKVTYVREDRLEKALVKEFKKIEINEETWKAAKSYVLELNEPEKANIKRDLFVINAKIEKETLHQIQTDRRFENGEIDKQARNRLIEYSRHSESELRATYSRVENMHYELEKLTEGFLDDVKHVTKRFLSTSAENKRELVDIFCENLRWNGKKAQWDWKKPYYYIVKNPNGLPR